MIYVSGFEKGDGVHDVHKQQQRRTPINRTITDTENAEYCSGISADQRYICVSCITTRNRITKMNAIYFNGSSRNKVNARELSLAHAFRLKITEMFVIV